MFRTYLTVRSAEKSPTHTPAAANPQLAVRATTLGTVPSHVGDPESATFVLRFTENSGHEMHRQFREFSSPLAACGSTPGFCFSRSTTAA